MRIAGYDVTSITKDTAQVGCTKVTRNEVKELAEAMDRVQVVQYRIQWKGDYFEVWVNCTSESLGGLYQIEEATAKLKEAISNWPSYTFRVMPV